ncbi:hypothetical protein F2Q69_00056995 [Brassica cretica]|uniref:Uncharacterized protein n=1 Tax=Brassica cretica TaxID=69181 RepID=A0A8S9MVH4_BRACR|nr:hypothetical protein F2Q69_00056995 [Brassica cretica]
MLCNTFWPISAIATIFFDPPLQFVELQSSIRPAQLRAGFISVEFVVVLWSSSVILHLRLSPSRLQVGVLLHAIHRRRHQQVAAVLRIAAVASVRAMTACPEAPESSLLAVAGIKC